MTLPLTLRPLLRLPVLFLFSPSIPLLGQAPAAIVTEPILNAHAGDEYGKAIPFRKIPGTAGTLALEVSGDRLYALESGGLSIYDLADPLRPEKLGSVGGMGNVRQLGSGGRRPF